MASSLHLAGHLTNASTMGSHTCDAENRMTGTLVNEYVFFAGRRTARRNGSGTLFYYFGDHLESSRVTVQAGQTTKCYDPDYYPYGKERIYTSTCPPSHKFTSQERDAESGLDYFIARHYPSGLGRFLQIDPGNAGSAPANPQGRKAYAYTSSTPWSWWMR